VYFGDYSTFYESRLRMLMCEGLINATRNLRLYKKTTANGKTFKEKKGIVLLFWHVHQRWRPRGRASTMSVTSFSMP